MALTLNSDAKCNASPVESARNCLTPNDWIAVKVPRNLGIRNGNGAFCLRSKAVEGVALHVKSTHACFGLRPGRFFLARTKNAPNEASLTSSCATMRSKISSNTMSTYFADSACGTPTFRWIAFARSEKNKSLRHSCGWNAQFQFESGWRLSKGCPSVRVQLSFRARIGLQKLVQQHWKRGLFERSKSKWSEAIRRGVWIALY